MVVAKLLPKPLKAYRIGDPNGQYPIFSGEGARKVKARWHSVGQNPIYCAEHYSTAMLEKLVHFSGIMPDNQCFLEIIIPQGISYETVTKDSVPNWHGLDSPEANQFGTAWFIEARSCLLLVPSVVARMESNILINPNHADFAQIEQGLEQPIWWDERLF